MAERASVKEFKLYELLITWALLCIWATVVFVLGLYATADLDNFVIFGKPLGFWFTFQGSIICCVLLLFVYCKAMDFLERKYGVHE